jgi:large subunit ribosomal protein L6
MSRIGKMPVQVPAGVKVICSNNEVLVEGPKGKLQLNIRPEIEIEYKDNIVTLKRKVDLNFEKSLHGLYRSLIFNMIEGVTKGYEKKLEINGTGFKATMQGKKIIFNLGYSHAIEYDIPDGIKVVVEENTKLSISGIDKQLVGHVASVIRGMKPPEPYKQKGVKYSDEVVRKKAGKAAKK